MSPEYIEQLKIIANNIEKYNLDNKTIAITGATGLIGGAIFDAIQLANYYNNLNIRLIVFCRDKSKLLNNLNEKYVKNIKVIESDLANETLTCDETIDIIIHCASITQPTQFATHPSVVINNNFLMTKNILDFAVQKQISRFVFLSSVEVYGEPNSSEKIKEDDLGTINLISTRGGYPETKRLCEILCRSYEKEFGLNCTIVRPSKSFGLTKNTLDNRLVNQFIKSAKKDRKIVLKTKGLQTFSFCYSLDVVDAILYIISCEKNDVFNISDNNADYRIIDIANIIAKYFNADVVVQEESNGAYVKFSHAKINSEKLYDMGWNPSIGFSKGLSLCLKDNTI